MLKVISATYKSIMLDGHIPVWICEGMPYKNERLFQSLDKKIYHISHKAKRGDRFAIPFKLFLSDEAEYYNATKQESH